MTGIALDRITRRYDRACVLDRVSLAVRPGEFLVLLGPSGCGKSTLLRVIAGLEAQDGGTVAIGGRPVDGLRPSRRDVAMVFQSYALYPHLTVFQNIALPLRMRRMTMLQRLPLLGGLLPGTRAQRRDFAREVAVVADLLGIGALLARKPGQLSGGQRQRVALARAMIRSPAVFLMDEPLSNLDARLRVTMRAEIVALHRRLGTTFVYVTHDQAEAMTMADRIAVMIGGRIRQVGTPAEIYERPDDLDIAGFVGTPPINILDAALLPVPGAPPGARIRAFRPEAASLGMAAAGHGIPGRIERLENLGSDLHVHVALTAAPATNVPGTNVPGTNVIVRLDANAQGHWQAGQAVMVQPDPARVLWFDADGARLVAP